MASKLIADGYFLSAENPTATADQRALESLALEVMQTPAVVKARAQAIGRWKICVGQDAPPETWAQFDQFLEEWVFCQVLKAVNSDANYPKVLTHFFGPPHQWFGMKVPGSRLGDSPDNNYGIIPVDSFACFEVSGQCFEPRLVDAPFVLAGDPSLATTLGLIDWQDLQINADGSFVITLDPQPANGRPNHIQTKPEARWFHTRDVRSDWRQIPISYRIRRLDPPTAPPLSIEQIAERAAQFIVFEVPAWYFFIRMVAGIKINTVMPPFGSGSIGGLVTQVLSLGRVELAVDEAFIVTAGAGGAKHRSLALQDPYWFYSFDFWNRICSLNPAQSVPNADGSITYVISKQDPGVHNWLDTCGHDKVSFMYRWQAIPKIPTAGDAQQPWIKGELAKLADLDKKLPAGTNTKRVTSTERQQQITDRIETFKLRYIDH